MIQLVKQIISMAEYLGDTVHLKFQGKTLHLWLPIFFCLSDLWYYTQMLLLFRNAMCVKFSQVCRKPLTSTIAIDHH
jgi:hypothetical protein